MKNHFPLFRPLRRAVLILTTLFLACVCTTKAQNFPDPPEAETGKLTVTLTPPGIDSGWHFVGEKIWRTSGAQATGLVLGNRDIEFRPVPGYIQPIQKTVHLASDKTEISLTRDYYKTTDGATGRLTVILKPDEVSTQSVALSKRARWRILGDDDTKWRDSGDSMKLPPGVYLIESKPVAGKTTPRPVSITVLEKKNRTAVATYFVQDSTIGTQPEVLDFSTINDTNLPYAYVGQIRTDNSLGTGCVVGDHSVATAAHLIFDEDNLTYFGGLQWLFQRYSGTHEPIPQIPKLVGIVRGYADQRTLDDSPGKSSAASRSFDVAALYFIASPGRNGRPALPFGGTADELLTSSNFKTLACYPVEGIPSANRSKMHATTPSNITFTANPTVPGFEIPFTYTTYSTTDITSSGGAAGGPVFVKNSDGDYVCVAIYLGGSADTVVTSFTSSVLGLIFWADQGGQGTGGITQVDGPGIGGGPIPGALKVNLKPSSGRWKLEPSPTARVSGSTASGLLPGTYSVKFTGLPGFRTPAPVSAIVSEAQLTTIKVKYTAIGPVTKITTQENNAIVSRNGFNVRGTASDPNGIRKYQVKITGQDAAIVLPGRTHFSGKISGKNITIQMRAQNRAGVWGDFTSITATTE